MSEEAKHPVLPGKLVLYFDGACAPRNPGGLTTYGFRLMTYDEPSVHIGYGCGVAAKAGAPLATANTGEYIGLGTGLRYLADRGWKGQLLIRGDSMLGTKQLTKDWNCNKPHLQKCLARCHELLQKLGGLWHVEWIPRDHNRYCDALCRRAWEREAGEKFHEVCYPTKAEKKAKKAAEAVRVLPPQLPAGEAPKISVGGVELKC